MSSLQGGSLKITLSLFNVVFSSYVGYKEETPLDKKIKIVMFGGTSCVIISGFMFVNEMTHQDRIFKQLEFKFAFIIENIYILNKH